MQNRGILITLRAAAIVIIVTGLNDVLASAVPRYEPLYLYLAAVGLVALTDGILLGVAAAALSISFYAMLFMPRPEALSTAVLTPAGAALAVAIVGSLIRGFARSRWRKTRPVPAVPVMPPLLETSAVAHVTDNAEVLAAIDELRNELRTAIGDLNASRSREGELADRTRSHAAEVAAMDMRIRQFEADREWALKVAGEARTRGDRERDLRLEAERLLAEARDEAGTMAGRLAELELSVRESEKLERERTALRARVADLERTLAAEMKVNTERERAFRRESETALDEARKESGAMAARVAELELSVRESEKRERALRLESETALNEARKESAGMTARLAELESALASEHAAHADRQRALAEAREKSVAMAARLAELESTAAAERATREQLEEEARNYDAKLQTLVTHLASDHEADLGQALSEKEEARAEARALSMKLSSLQRKHDEDAARLRDAETLLAETRAAAQGEIDKLRAQLLKSDAPVVARPRVMIVHPDADLRAAASTTLERAGYDVVTAADGLEALRVAIARQPEIVIAETSMPKMDGRELCQLLKSQEKTAHIRVVLLMRASDEEPRGDLPPDEILRKPVPVETLKATLANLLSSSRA